MPDDVNLRVLGGIFCLEEISSVPLNSGIVTQVSRWEPIPSYAPTPGDFGHERTPSIFAPLPPIRTVTRLLPRTGRHQTVLALRS